MRQLDVIGFAGALILAACSSPKEPAPAVATTDSENGTGAETAIEQPEPTAPPVEGEAATNDGPAAFDDTVDRIEVDAGTEFVLRLPANMATPMGWTLEPTPDPAAVVLDGQDYLDEPPPGCEPCTGYPGVLEMRFTAKASAVTTLHLRYSHVAKKNQPPQRELVIPLIVK